MNYIAWTTTRRRKKKNGKGGKIEFLARLKYVDPETGEVKEFWRSASNAQEVRRALSQLEEDFLDRGPTLIGSECMTFTDLVEHCKENRYCDAIYDAEGRKVAGVRGKKTAWGHMKVLEKFFGRLALREISVALIKKYKLSRLKTKTKRGTFVSITTVNHELSTMRAMLNEAIVNDWLKISPFKRVRPGELINTADERKRQTVITLGQEDDLLEQCDGDYKRHFKAFLICLLDTGARRGELFGVRKRDLHFGSGQYYVNGELCETCQGDSGDHMIVTSYKGKTVLPRPVPVTPRAKEALLDLIENPGVAAFKKGRKSKVKPDPDLVFGVRWTVQRAWEDARASANLENVRLHDLRHTAGTRLADHLPLHQVGMILGHSDPRTTQRYVNRTPPVVKKAGQVLHELRVEHIEKLSEVEELPQTDVVN